MFYVSPLMLLLEMPRKMFVIGNSVLDNFRLVKKIFQTLTCLFDKDVTREMCAGFYPRTLSHVGRIPCIVKSICDQRDLLTGAPLNCLLRDQWTEAKETFEAVLSIMLSQANRAREKPNG